MNKYDEYILVLENNLKMLKGEIYNFHNGKIKKSAKIARQALLNIQKICSPFRKEIMEELKKMPKRKHNWSEESINRMLKGRKRKDK